MWAARCALLAALLGYARSSAPNGPFVTSINGLGVPVDEWPSSDESVSTLTLSSLSSVDPLAVCNDGTPGAYYFAPGQGSDSSLWLVYLEGSMFCWSKTSCSERMSSHHYWMSSATWGPSMLQGGIFAVEPGQSGWSNANRVFVKYCSSDLWSGDTGVTPNTFGYQFRGSRIVAAVITDLLQNRGMGATPGQRLLFGGCSAGAIGAMNNIEAVQAMLPPGLEYSNLLDGAALLDIQPAGWTWSGELETLQSLISNMTSFTSPVFPPFCSTNFPGAEWKCLIGQYRMPLLTTKLFINAPQFDMFELMYDTDNYAPQTPAQLAFVEEFQTGTLSLFSALPPTTGIFSSTCLSHCLSGQPTYQDFLVNNYSMSTVLNAWYFGGKDAQLGNNGQVISICSGWPCTGACGVNSQSGLPCNMGDPKCQAVNLQTDTAADDTTTGGAQQKLTTSISLSERLEALQLRLYNLRRSSPPPGAVASSPAAGPTSGPASAPVSAPAPAQAPANASLAPASSPPPPPGPSVNAEITAALQRLESDPTAIAQSLSAQVDPVMFVASNSPANNNKLVTEPLVDVSKDFRSGAASAPAPAPPIAAPPVAAMPPMAAPPAAAPAVAASPAAAPAPAVTPAPAPRAAAVPRPPPPRVPLPLYEQWLASQSQRAMVASGRAVSSPPPAPAQTVQATESSLTAQQLKALRQAQCNAAALAAQSQSQAIQHSDFNAAQQMQQQAQSELSECLAQAADSSTARRLMSAVPECCYGRGDAPLWRRKAM